MTGKIIRLKRRKEFRTHPEILDYESLIDSLTVVHQLNTVSKHLTKTDYKTAYTLHKNHLDDFVCNTSCCRLKQYKDGRCWLCLKIEKILKTL